MTESEWNRAIVRVDPQEMLAWLALHSGQGANSLPVSTKRDNYGLAGSKAKKSKSHDRAKWDSFQSAVKL